MRRQFDRRAERFGRHDALPREIERRMIERLELVRLQPERVLDIGCGAGASRQLLRQRFPATAWLGVDISERMLRAAGPRWTARLAFGRRKQAVVCADAAQLPLADAAVDLIHSNLMLHWHPQPHTLFPEWKRVLRANGLLSFSCFGPDTLKELRAAFAAAQIPAAPMPFVDMHDFGDMLVAAGFAAPVMDAELLTLTYRSADALLADVRALGGNPRDDRASALPSGRQARNLLAALGARRTSDERLALTFEVAYGHAWQPVRAKTPGAVTIGLDDVRAELQRRR